MTLEDKSRMYFEQYMGNLAREVDRLESGEYADDRVENSWLDYRVGWAQCSLFMINEERDKIRIRLDEMRAATRSHAQPPTE